MAKIKTKLTLTVVVESDSMSKEQMMQEVAIGLNDLVGMGLANGVITQDNNMTLEEHDIRIEHSVGTV